MKCAENAECKNSPKICHLCTIAALLHGICSTASTEGATYIRGWPSRWAHILVYGRPM